MEEWWKSLISQGFAVLVAGYLLFRMERTLAELRDGMKSLEGFLRERMK